MRRLLIAVSLLILAMGLTAAPAAAQSSTLFRNVRVFDGDSMLAGMDVLIADGRIVRVGRTGGRIEAPTGADIVDGSGGTLLPGLIDAHTHVFGDALVEALVFGITTELDMFTDVGQLAGLQREQRSGDVRHRADIFSAGTLVTAPGGHGTQFGFAIPTITDPESADAFVAARIAEGADWIKVVYEDGDAYDISFPSIDRATLAAVIRAAHRQQRKAVVHVSTAEAARHALEAGADGLVHVFVDRPMDDDLLRLARERNAFVIPTLVVIHGITGTGGGAALVEDARLRPYLLPQSRTSLAGSFPARPGAERQFGHAVDATRRLYATGVTILAGSDAPNPGTAHGAALHRELELLVQAGLSPLDALRAATSAPARAFGLDDRGRVKPGLKADLVLVEGDPSADIAATRAIRGVWKAGIPVDRAAYAATVAAADASAARRAADEDRARADGIIADFELGSAATLFGTDWMPSTDAMIGGSSTVEYDVVGEGAGGSGHSLRLTGRIADGLPNAWAGIMWSPGAQPMQPHDLSHRQGVSFSARGDGRDYAVLLFSASRGMAPIMRVFATTADWQEVSMTWADFGVSGNDIMAVLIVATPPAGDFSIVVDDVRLN